MITWYSLIVTLVLLYAGVAMYYFYLLLKRVAEMSRITSPLPPETGPGMALLFVLAVLVQAVWHASTWPRFWFESVEEKK